MRLLNGADDPPSIRIRRRRRLQRHVVYAASGIFALVIVSAGAWYLSHEGRFAALLDATQTRIAAIGADLNLTVESVQVEGRVHADGRAILDALGVKRG